jgi:hypothetical protein
LIRINVDALCDLVLAARLFEARFLAVRFLAVRFLDTMTSPP